MTENWDAVETDNSKKVRNWLQKLTEAACADAENDIGTFPKVLFILDDDYGELTTILYLVAGVDCFTQSRVLLTPRVYEKNHNALPGRIEKWVTEDDLKGTIESYQPNVVVFGAGYLIPVHNLLTNESLERVCQFAAEQKAKILTADPFLGLLSEWSPKGLEHIISINIPDDASPELLSIKKIADKKLHTELAMANSFLRSCLHIYPAYTDYTGVQVFSSDSKNRSFFNEKLLIPDKLRSTEPGDKPHWVFIISEVDFQTQAMHHGVGPFAAIVWSLLNQGVDLGRKVIFLGPKSLTELLFSMRASTHQDIHIFNFGAFGRVMSMLLTSEYSFYWNVVSHTILLQLWNGRPVILLDKGHLARAIPNLYERVIAWYYQGWEPYYFDQKKPLSLAALADVQSSYSKKKTALMEAYRRAPSPEKLFRSLMEDCNC